MTITFLLIVRDGQGEFIVDSYKDIEEAIEAHKRLETKQGLQEWIESWYKVYIGEVDQYYINNPFKRFDVDIIVHYTGG